jgi:hypothetical protein
MYDMLYVCVPLLAVLKVHEFGFPLSQTVPVGDEIPKHICIHWLTGLPLEMVQVIAVPALKLSNSRLFAAVGITTNMSYCEAVDVPISNRTARFLSIEDDT